MSNRKTVLGLELVCVVALLLGSREAIAEPANVFLLGDDQSEAQVQRALEAAGHNVTYAGPYYDWNGESPSVQGHDVVIYLDGYSYGYLLTPEADSALAMFVASGGGLIITEWATYEAHGTWNPLVGALLPVTSPEADYDYPSVWKVIDPTHQLAAWLPNRWGDGASSSYVVAHENATVVMESNEGNPMLTYRTDTGGTVIHVNHDMTYETPSIHPNALRVMVNSVEFAAGVSPADCNDNSVPDFVDVLNGDGTDINGNHVLDECDPDCNANGIPDDLDLVPGSSFTEIPFEFDVTTPGEWDYLNNCDDCVTAEIPLPFSVTLGGETLTQFTMSSNGYVELFRTGESADYTSYGPVQDLVSSGDPGHTFLMAAFDDLDSGSVGGYGYRTEFGRITFYWVTPTYADDDGTYDWMNDLQIVLSSDGTVQWNFGSANFATYGYDLFSGIYFGYGVNQLHELASRTIPETESLVYTGPEPAYSADANSNCVPDECEPDCNDNGRPDDLDIAPPIDPGVTETGPGCPSAGSLDWRGACDTCNSGVVELPFSVAIGAEIYTAFQQTSDGYVELLRDGDTAYGFYYGLVADLIAANGGFPGNPTHTYLMAAFDDLDSEAGGAFGYRIEADRVVYYWRTETYADDDDGLLNEFTIILHDDGSVRWYFGYTTYASFGYDLFTGVYLGHSEQLLYEIARYRIPEYESWVFTKTGLPGGGSSDDDGDGVPDECACAGDGDMTGNGTVNLEDLGQFLNCLQGPGVAVDPSCDTADMDCDQDVDLEDVAAFCAAF